MRVGKILIIVGMVSLITHQMVNNIPFTLGNTLLFSGGLICYGLGWVLLY